MTQPFDPALERVLARRFNPAPGITAALSGYRQKRQTMIDSEQYSAPRTAKAGSGLLQPRRMIAIVSVLSAMALVVLDAAIANVALPTIAGALHVTPAMSVLVITAYQMALVVGLLPCAALGESLGHRRVFTIGVALFTGASVASALSPSLPWLIAARFVQGLGGAAVLALGIALMRFVVTHDRFGSAIGWNALTVALSSAAGPAIGAGILSVASWPWLFAVNLPVGAAALLSARALPDIPGTARWLDVFSVGLNAGVFALLVVGAEFLPTNPVLAITLFIAAALGLVALIRREMPKTVPLIPLDLLRGPSFCISVVASVCCFVGQTAGLGGPALLPSTRAPPICDDDGTLHDAVAAYRGHRGPGRRLSRQPRIDGLALCRGWLLSRDRPCSCEPLAAAGRRAAACAVHHFVWLGLRSLQRAKQPQHVFVSAARAERRRGRHAGHRSVGGSNFRRRYDDAPLHADVGECGAAAWSWDRSCTDAGCRTHKHAADRVHANCIGRLKGGACEARSSRWACDGVGRTHPVARLTPLRRLTASIQPSRPSLSHRHKAPSQAACRAI